MEFVCELLGVCDPGILNRGIRPYDKRKLETALKGVNVEVTHRKSNRQVLDQSFVVFDTSYPNRSCFSFSS